MSEWTVQHTGDREGWTHRLVVWDYEGKGRLREIWRAFVVPVGRDGPGGPYAHRPTLTRVRTGRVRGWVLEQSGGLDV